MDYGEFGRANLAQTKKNIQTNLQGLQQYTHCINQFCGHGFVFSGLKWNTPNSFQPILAKAQKEKTTLFFLWALVAKSFVFVFFFRAAL